MRWNNVDRFHLMTVFVAVAEAQSFSAAARRLRMSSPAVTRAVSLLEQRLGVRLLTRTTRFVRATEAGTRYLDDARRILTDVDEADEAAAGINAAPRGHLAITAPVLFGRIYVVPIIAAHQSKFAQTAITALFVDHIVNLIDEGLDIGIRIGELPDSSLRAIRVGHVRRVVCASPAYLERHGIPKVPKDLTEHEIVASTALAPTAEWVFTRGQRKLSVRVSARTLVNTNDAVLETVKSGLGLTRLLSYQVAPQLASGELKTVLADFEGPDLPIHIVHREGRYGSAKVRSFVDLAVERLRAEPSLR